jgi:hypothetical protein
MLAEKIPGKYTRKKEKLSADELRAMKAMAKQPQPKGFKTFLRAIIKSIADKEQMHDAYCAIQRATEKFFRLTGDYFHAEQQWEDCIKANANQ